MHERAAERAAELVAAVVRLRLAGGLKEVARVQRLVAEELEPVAVERVRPHFVVRLTTPPLKRPNSAGANT